MNKVQCENSDFNFACSAFVITDFCGSRTGVLQEERKYGV